MSPVYHIKHCEDFHKANKINFLCTQANVKSSDSTVRSPMLLDFKDVHSNRMTTKFQRVATGGSFEMVNFTGKTKDMDMLGLGGDAELR